MKTPLIMVIAGSRWQIPILKKIRAKGYRSVVVNLYQDSPAFAYADFSEVADILDRNLCLNIARKYDIDAVLSEECDIAMPTVAYIAESLSLPSIGMKNAELYTNKSQMRLFSELNGLPSPPSKKCSSIEEAKSFYHDMGGTMIMKPLDSNSSRGVYTISSIASLVDSFEKSLSFSKQEKQVILERYIRGCEFTVDGIVINGVHKTLAISEKKHYDFNENIAYELYFSRVNPQYDYEYLSATNDAFVNASCLADGTLTHAEYKYENGKFWLIEIAARGGGNMISSDIVPLMSGYDNYHALICSALGKPVTLPQLKEVPEGRCAVLRFFDTDFESGVVKEIQGEEVLKHSPLVHHYEFNFKPGDFIKKAENDAARIGFYIAYADSDHELRTLMAEIDEKVRIIPAGNVELGQNNEYDDER